MDGKAETQDIVKPLLEGVFAAALTPLDDQLNPDHEAFATHCKRLLAAGCHGLGIFGTTGEANSLSVAERLAALEALASYGVPGEKLLPGTGSCALPDAVRLSQAALEAGTAGVLVLPPFYYKGVSNDGLFRFFAELIERVADDKLRVYLYHIPQMTGVGFDSDLIERLLESYPEVIVGIKDSAGDRGRIEHLCRRFPGFQVFAGTERYLLETREYGGAGCISATVNVTSMLARQVFDAYGQGDKIQAQSLQDTLTNLRGRIEAFPLVPALKVLMGELSGDEVWRHLRPPLASLGNLQAQELLEQVPASELLATDSA